MESLQIQTRLSSRTPCHLNMHGPRSSCQIYENSKAKHVSAHRCPLTALILRRALHSLAAFRNQTFFQRRSSILKIVHLSTRQISNDNDLSAFLQNPSQHIWKHVEEPRQHCHGYEPGDRKPQLRAIFASLPTASQTYAFLHVMST